MDPANMPAATAHFSKAKEEKEAIRAAEIEAAKANAPAATQHFGKIAAEKKAEKDAKKAELAAQPSNAPAATDYFNRKKEEGSDQSLLGSITGALRLGK